MTALGQLPETTCNAIQASHLLGVSCSRGQGTDFWEPSWEPFFVDLSGRLWTPVDERARRSVPHGRSWTPADAAWRSTDQEVGCSSRPGRAAEIHVVAGGFTCPVLVEGFEEADLWEPFA